MMIDIACREQNFNMGINLQKINFQEWHYWFCAMCIDNRIYLTDMVGKATLKDKMQDALDGLVDESYSEKNYQTNTLKSQSRALNDKYLLDSKKILGMANKTDATLSKSLKGILCLIDRIIEKPKIRKTLTDYFKKKINIWYTIYTRLTVYNNKQ